MEDRHPRGVFATTFDGPCGGDVLVGVTSEGRAVAYALVDGHADRPKVVEGLRKIVNALDPPTPPLRILR